METSEQSFEYLKFVPAEAAGGARLLRGHAAVFPYSRFCPTGGIKPANMEDYLALDNVVCVGGSWLAPRDLVATGDWGAIGKLATAATRQ
ncbi:MAG: hypothetical protein KJO54_10250 [Gammaproteobacteria bacterium]|nr:hypothetical protein [Gammaproteobacteria bacterium]NNF61858.1 hypothetical protein [Gammaproteobacteria bacterium]